MKHFLLALPAALLLAGCTSSNPEKEMPQYKMAMGVPDGKINYKPIPTKDLSFAMISKCDVNAGKKCELVFALSNKGMKEISIPEWYSNEPDNVIVSVQPWLPGMTQPDPENWTELSFDLKKPVLHYPLTLLPGNQALVSKSLDFIDKLAVSPGKMRRFFIRAKLNLKSAPLLSEVYVLQVFPKNAIIGGK